MTVRQLFEYAVKNNAEDCDIVTVDYNEDGEEMINLVTRTGRINGTERTIEVL